MYFLLEQVRDSCDMCHMSSMHKDELTTKEVAERLGFGQTSILNWGRQGYIPFRYTPGGHCRYRVSDIEDFRARYLRGELAQAVHTPPTRPPRKKRAIVPYPERKGQDVKLKEHMVRHGIPVLTRDGSPAHHPRAPAGRVEKDFMFLHKPGSKKLTVIESRKKRKPARKPGMKPAGQASK
jgi:excisionase family DNA binding protein